MAKQLRISLQGVVLTLLGIAAMGVYLAWMYQAFNVTFGDHVSHKVNGLTTCGHMVAGWTYMMLNSGAIIYGLIEGIKHYWDDNPSFTIPLPQRKARLPKARSL